MFTNINNRAVIIAAIVLALFTPVVGWALALLGFVLSVVNGLGAVTVITLLAIVRWREEILNFVFNEDEEEEEEDWTV